MPPPQIRGSVGAFFFRPNLHYSTRRTLLSNLHTLHSNAPPSAARTSLWALNTAFKFFVAFHFVTSYIGSIGPTQGISMVPTIPHSYRGSPYILESALHRRGRNIGVGDVVTYTMPYDTSSTGCKRVIGMPGDFVSILSPGRLQEDLHKEDNDGDWARVKGEVVRVPEGHCWLAGDNLEWSRDSRVFGAVPLNLVKGKVLAVVWPPSAWKTLGGAEGLKETTEGEHELVVAR